MDIKAHHVTASPDNPQLLVQSAGTRQLAAHKAGALKRVKNQMSSDDLHAAVQDFKKAVNMSPKVLTAWLTTKESKAVGFKNAENGESVGHRSGKKIVTLLDKTETTLTSGDIAHTGKVVGDIHRHLAQRPSGDVSETHWRHSLMNWGHDPLKIEA